MFARPYDTIRWRGTAVPLFHSPPDLFVYVLHCRRKLHHSFHYTGFTSNIRARMDLHRAGQGAKLTRAYNKNGIEYELALLIRVDSCEEGHRLERYLKSKHGARHYCPICKGQPLDAHTLLERGSWPLRIHSFVGPRRPMPGGRYFP